MIDLETADLDNLPFHPDSEKLVNILCTRCQNDNPMFFRVLVAYYFGKVAGMMRVIVKGPTGKIPVNVYAVNLATSGYGKGKSTGIIEDEVIHLFRQEYEDTTFPMLAEEQIYKLAHKRAQKKGTDPDEEVETVKTEFNGLGPMLFGYSEGTSPALKQLRQKLLMSDTGSLSFEIDEIGSNLSGNLEMFNTYLELYDKGKVKQKLVKNTTDNKRSEEIVGMTPANLMAFGTPAKLLDGAKVETEFMALLETGYARRAFFGFAKGAGTTWDLTPEEMLDRMVDTSHSTFLDQLADQIGALADAMNHGKELVMSRDVQIAWIAYMKRCGLRSDEIGDHDEARKAEMRHRYFKALKLAGAYAFIDGSHEISEDHLCNAIRLAEESGKAFEQMLTRDQPFVKLAKYLATVKNEMTQADLVQVLPFYKGTQAARAEMLMLATEWGYKNNVIIKKSYIKGIQLLRGESLEETNLDEMILSYSDHVAYNYRPEKVPFDKLDMLTQVQGFHWFTHHTKDGHRSEDKVEPGFNMVVIDVDGTCSLETAKLLLKDYKAHYYTTKRHGQDGEDRFRIILPTNYVLKLDSDDYKEFMKNLFDWLPFDVDAQTGQRARKWLCHQGHSEFTDGKLLDVLPFIPKTEKAEEQQEKAKGLRSLPALERWFVHNTGDGNRSNNMIRYALILVDSGHSAAEVEAAVLNLNQQINPPLTEQEIRNTILVTAAKAIGQRAA